MTCEKSAANPAWHNSQIWPVRSFTHSTNRPDSRYLGREFLFAAGRQRSFNLCHRLLLLKNRLLFTFRNRRDLSTFLQCHLVIKQLPALFITGCGRNKKSSSALTANERLKNVALSEKNLKLGTIKKKRIQKQTVSVLLIRR